jgi:hypothetical protein
LRVGLSLFVLSWLPIAQLYIWIADLHGDDAGQARLTIWGLQAIVGVVGLVLAGVAAKAVVKRVGWRHLPKVLWSMLRTGSVPESPEANS